jgi:hypothetical protein
MSDHIKRRGGPCIVRDTVFLSQRASTRTDGTELLGEDNVKSRDVEFALGKRFGDNAEFYWWKGSPKAVGR